MEVTLLGHLKFEVGGIVYQKLVGYEKHVFDDWAPKCSRKQIFIFRQKF